MASNKDVEQALIGSLLKNPSQYPLLRDYIQPEDFSHSPFGLVWRAFASLFERGLSIDSVTVGDELERMGVLSDITNSTNSYSSRAALSWMQDDGEPENAGSYAFQVLDYSANRHMISELETTAKELAAGRPVSDVYADHVTRTASLRYPHKAASRTKSLNEAVSDAYDRTERATGGEIMSVRTGYKDLDFLLDGGLYGSDLYIAAARPGQGKTSFLLSIAKNAAEFNNHVTIFSLEMGTVETAMRLLSMESGVSFGKQRRGAMTDEERTSYMGAVDKLASKSEPYNIVVNDLPAITIGGIRRELARIGKTDLVIVDYLQLAGVDGRYESRVREVSEVSAGLKAIAKEFDVPVLAAAQLSRALENRSDKRPVLADLRESGSIENDADVVMFIYRPDLYEPGAAKNLTELIVQKHRNGPLGSVDLVFRPELTRFESAVTRISGLTY